VCPRPGSALPGWTRNVINPMRLIALCLATLLLLIQYPLWLGKGGWLRAWDLDQQVIAAQKKNEELKARNAKLASEVSDLKDGTGAVEERARLELGMIKGDEIFIQISQANGKPADAPPAASRQAAAH
jgi:cell division protein FtsB